jgi:hypothetical protein
MPEVVSSDSLLDQLAQTWLNLNQTTCLYKGGAAKKYNGGFFIIISKFTRNISRFARQGVCSHVAFRLPESCDNRIL